MVNKSRADPNAQHLWLPLTLNQENCQQPYGEDRWPLFIQDCTKNGELNHLGRRLWRK